MSENGIAPVDFTHTLRSFTLEGHEFRRRKVPAKQWAETLARVAISERKEIDKKEGGKLFAVSADGLHELIALAIHPDDVAQWNQMYADGLIEFGELSGLRDWLWEQMTERPLASDTPSSDGPGSNSAASSKAESSSPVEVQRG